MWLTDEQDPCRVCLQAHQAGSEDPFSTDPICKGPERDSEQNSRDGVEPKVWVRSQLHVPGHPATSYPGLDIRFLPPEDHGELLLDRVDLAHLLGYGSISADGGGVVVAIIREADIGFIYTSLRRFCKKSANVDDGDKEERQYDEQDPWLLLLGRRQCGRGEG